jgi:hypothetical protein
VSPEIAQRLPVVSHVAPPGVAVATNFSTDNPPLPASHETITLVSPKLTVDATGAAGPTAVVCPPETTAEPVPNKFVATIENEYVVPGLSPPIEHVVAAVEQLPFGEPDTV